MRRGKKCSTSLGEKNKEMSWRFTRWDKRFNDWHHQLRLGRLKNSLIRHVNHTTRATGDPISLRDKFTYSEFAYEQYRKKLFAQHLFVKELSFKWKSRIYGSIVYPCSFVIFLCWGKSLGSISWLGDICWLIRSVDFTTHFVSYDDPKQIWISWTKRMYNFEFHQQILHQK